MTRTLRIDFISDIVCPWCVVGLGGLDAALGRLAADGIAAEITFRPFELNPGMAPEGENIVEHIGRKYGSTPEQSAASRAMIRERAAEVGFDMRMDESSRIRNTFDAHRLLAWAAATAGPAAQKALKQALFAAYFTEGRDISDRAVLAEVAGVAGLDAEEAAAVLADGRFADEVRAEQGLWRGRGINAVPAVVVEGKWLISGGQPASLYEEALRKIGTGGARTFGE